MIRALSLAAAFAFSLVEVAEASVLFVNPDGSGEFPTIQAALDYASPGDTISLSDGTFHGPGNRELEIVMSVTLTGRTSDPSLCIIECDDLPGLHVPKGGSVDLSLRGLTVRGSSAGVQFDDGGHLVAVNCIFLENTGHAIACNWGAIYLEQSQFLRNENLAVFARESEVTVLSCAFIGNQGVTTAGLRSEQAGDTWIEDSIFRDNIALSDGGGLAIGGEDFPFEENDAESQSGVVERVVARCIFENNRAGYGGGGLWIEDASVRVEDCLFRNNDGGSLGGGMGVEDNGYAEVLRCEFIGNRADLGGAVGTDTPSVTLTECLLIGNEAEEGGAIGSRSWGDVTVTRSEIRANSAARGGVYGAKDSARATFSESVIVGNHATLGSIFWGEEFSFSACTVSRNLGDVFAATYILELSQSIFSQNAGTTLLGCPDYFLAYISCTNIHGNSGGDWEGCLAEFEHVDGNMSADPLFCNVTAGDYSLAFGSPCLDENNDPSCETMGAFPDPGCEAPVGAVLVVRPDGSGDLPTIQAALDVAVDRDTISLADGVFTGPGNRDLSYFGKQVVVRSESEEPENCVIDCGGTPAIPHRGFVFVSGETAASLLEGVTITGGAAFGQGVARFGGAIYCAESSPTVRNCIFDGNVAQRNGGAINLFHSNSLIESCIVRGNEAPLGAGISCSSSSPTIRSTQVTGNVASESGGGVRYFSQFGASPHIESTTISGNESPLGGGVECVVEISLQVDRGIVWDNCADEGAEFRLADAGCSVNLTCSDVDTSGVWLGDPGAEFVFEGGDNISLDPEFCDPLSCTGSPSIGGSFTLDAASPCSPIHAPQGCGLIGVHSVGCDATAEAPGAPLEEDRLVLRSYPNPFSRLTVLRLQLPADGSVEVAIYDVAGKRVRSLASGMLEAGSRSFDWDGTNEGGHNVPNGVYLCRVVTGAFSTSTTLTVVGR